MVIIGKDGRIADIHRGYSEEMLGAFVDKINALLAEEVSDSASNS